MNIKGLKKNYKPLVKSGSQMAISWDFEPILKDNGEDTIFATWEQVILDKIISFEEIKKIILAYYNNKIQQRIVEGFKWEGNKVWLTPENQINYRTAYDLAKMDSQKNLPVILKFGDDEAEYFSFNTLRELEDFYMAFTSYIQETIRNGWKEKDEINWEDYR